MKFIKFPSLENSYRKAFIEKAENEGLTTGEFVVQEKVHGANLSLWTDGKRVNVASRNDFLDNPEKFYNSDIVRDNHEDHIKQLFEAVKQINPEVKQVGVFGEIFGCSVMEGFPKPKYSQIQKGIYYSPDLHFYAFDVLVDDKFLSVDQTNELLHRCGFLYAKTLFRGTLDKALEYSNEFDSTLPSELGLEHVTNNVCEGVVIRPITPKYFSNGSAFIIKNKNEKWTEKAKGKKEKVERGDPNVSEELNEVIQNDLMPLINENRLRNVLSKIGEVTDKDFGRIMKEFSNDALDDFMKDRDDLSKEDKRAITKIVGKEAANLLRANFVNVIDGTF